MTQITVPAVPIEVTYAVTSASTGPFTVPFPFFDEDDVFATVTDALGAVTALVHTTDFTFSVLTVPVGQEGTGYEGGALDLVAAIGADGATTLRIYRSTVIDRTANFPSTGPFSMPILNDEQNKEVMILQEIAQDISDFEAEAARHMALDPSDTYWDSQSKIIKNVTEPLANSDAATKFYVDTNGGGGGAGGGAFNTYVTVKDFGAIGDGVTDDTAALNDFFEFYKGSEYNYIIMDWSGVYAISGTVALQGNSRTFFAGKLIVIDGSVIDEVLTFNSTNSVVHNMIQIIGHSSTNTYANRTCNVLVALGILGHTIFDGFILWGAKKWAVTTQKGVTPSIAGANFGNMMLFNCGSAGVSGATQAWMAPDFTYTGRTDAGGATSTVTQRCELTGVTNIPDALEIGDLVRISDEAYQVMELDVGAETMSVYPWIKDYSETSGTIRSMHGGGVRFNTSNGASIEIGLMYILRCGVGFFTKMLYGGVVHNMTVQSTPVVIATEGQNLGMTFSHIHPEVPADTSWGILGLTDTKAQIFVTGNAVPRYNDIERLSVTASDGVKTHSSNSFRGLGIRGEDGNILSYRGRSYTTDVSSGSINNKPPENFTSSTKDTTFTVEVEYYEAMDRLFGYKDCRIWRGGTDAYGGQINGTVINVEAGDITAGITIMGGTSYYVPASSSGTMIELFFNWDEQNWIVTANHGTTKEACQRTASIQTTDATPKNLKADGPGGTSEIRVDTDAMWSFLGTVTGITDDGAQGASYKIEGAIKNLAGVVTLVGTPTVTVLAEDDAAWDCVVTADDPNNALNVAVTGAAATTINWSMSIQTSIAYL